MPTHAPDIDHRDRSNWIDGVLADSCPAIDPPSWTPGIARPARSLLSAQINMEVFRTEPLIEFMSI
jgi:hypothetical protein